MTEFWDAYLEVYQCSGMLQCVREASGLSENLYRGQRLINRKRSRKADRDPARGVNVLYWHVHIIFDRRGE